jgi:hypothetical protein
LENTAKIHDFKLCGEFQTCEECAIAKVGQSNVNKDWKGGSQILGQRLYYDISSVIDSSYGGSKFWALIVDDYTDFCWSIFLKNKSDLKEKLFSLLTDLKIAEVSSTSIATTLEAISHSTMLVARRDSRSSLNSQGHILLNVMARWKESFKHFTEEFELC